MTLIYSFATNIPRLRHYYFATDLDKFPISPHCAPLLYGLSHNADTLYSSGAWYHLQGNVGDWVLDTVAAFGHRVGLIDGVTGAETTYAQLHAWVRAVETGLTQQGCRKGDVAAAVLPNCPEYAVAWLALARRGVVLSGVNPIYIKDELVRHFQDCGARYVFTDMEHFPTVAEAIKETPGVERVFVVCGGAEVAQLPPSPRVAPFFSLRVVPQALPMVVIDPKTTTCVMPYSSGTTGVPKGVMITHYAVAASVSTVLNDEFSHPSLGERIICYLPFYHTFGFTMNLLLGLIRGATIVTMPKFLPRPFLKLIQDHKVKKLFTVPPILLFLTKDPRTKDFDLSSVRYVLAYKVMVGAAPAGKDLISEFMAKYPHVEYMLQGYGMTECGCASHLTPAVPASRDHPGSCGILAPGFEAMIVNPESGIEITALGVRGEIWTRSPTLMAGYHNRPDETANTIDQDGWLHTGDIGYVDADGYWYVVDRIKELIKVKGFQVAPAELEDVLLSCGGIADAAVIGVPHAKSGEVPRAFVVRKPGARLTEDDVVNFVKGKVASYKELCGGVKFVPELPKSASGKILRRILRDSQKSKL